MAIKICTIKEVEGVDLTEEELDEVIELVEEFIEKSKYTGKIKL